MTRLLNAAKAALDEMRSVIAPGSHFTDVLDELDAAIAEEGRLHITSESPYPRPRGRQPLHFGDAWYTLNWKHTEKDGWIAEFNLDEPEEEAQE